MPRATTQRHPPDQLIHAIRAALLSTIKAECPEVLENLRDAVFTPLIQSMPREALVALLKRRAPHPVDMPSGSPHRQVRAQIVRWARRWHLNTPWIRAEAWRTLYWWARSALDSRPAGQALLLTIRAEWPQVLDDLRDAVFTPLIQSMPREALVALLTRRAPPHPVDMPRGSPHRQVRAQIVRWARRWHLNAVLSKKRDRGGDGRSCITLLTDRSSATSHRAPGDSVRGGRARRTRGRPGRAGRGHEGGPGGVAGIRSRHRWRSA